MWLRFNLRLLAQNGIWVKFYHFWLKNEGEKWSKKTFFKFLREETIFLKFILLHREEAVSTSFRIEGFQKKKWCLWYDIRKCNPKI